MNNLQTTSRSYCFTAIVGQEDMKTALILNAVNPKLGGILIRGEKGTAKSTAVRALAELLPPQAVVENCRFGCDPRDLPHLCPECQEKLERGEKLITASRRMRVIELPVNATEDRVAGSLDMEHALKTGEKKFESGILAQANRNILYVDEVNLLDDHIVDILLDSAAMGVNTVEREGVSFTHPAAFMLVGTMKPEEGDLRPQLLDRFGLSVTVSGERDLEKRAAILAKRLEFERDSGKFFAEAEAGQRRLRERIENAGRLLDAVEYSPEILEKIASLCVKLEVDGHRADITILKTALTRAAFDDRKNVTGEDVLRAARFALPHRLRRKPFEETADITGDMLTRLLEGGAV
ncbi:MAG: ATP-binding protein [Treponema sp.]|nr:ATP-binding protein [Treponema sp.]